MRNFILRLVAVLLVAGLAAPGRSADAPPSLAQLQALTAKRFPQPVKVGDLIGRQVLRHLGNQPTIGFVSDVVAGADESVVVVIDLGGRFAFSRRPVAVPVEAMALNGQFLEVNAYTPEQLAALPTFSATGKNSVPTDTMLSLALSKPAH